MKNLLDINIEEYKVTIDKVSINLKNMEVNDSFTVIKCFKNMEDVSHVEGRKINLIKIQKSIFLNLTHLSFIDLRDNKLQKISKNFSYLKYLRVIKLDDNNISYFPSFLGKMEKLEYISLCNNALTFIPSSIQYLQKLKTLKLSNNKIKTLPIEFGLLKSLESLYIDANYFTEIPTTICYLKHLTELSFEWLEFLEPPVNKTIKENLGKTMVTLIRSSLQDMIKNNILYCDFVSFVERNSNPKKEENLITSDNETDEFNIKRVRYLSGDNFSHIGKLYIYLGDDKLGPTELGMLNKKFLKIFPAIENNYYGVIQAMINDNEEYIKIKNTDNKTPLYVATNVDIRNLILNKMDILTIPNNYVYLHKAIRMRDPLLTKQLIDLGVNVNATDDQGIVLLNIQVPLAYMFYSVLLQSILQSVYL
jgi:Leucine-rich repeat (LRR) protein